MKLKFFLAGLLTLAAQLSFATSEVDHPLLVLQRSASYPFVGNSARSTKLVIYRSGLIVRRLSPLPGENSPVKETVLAQINSYKAQGLVTAVEALKVGPLRLTHPNQPPCMDAPGYAYRAYQVSGQVIEIATISNCRTALRADRQGREQTLSLKALLDTMNALEALPGTEVE